MGECGRGRRSEGVGGRGAWGEGRSAGGMYSVSERPKGGRGKAGAACVRAVGRGVARPQRGCERVANLEKGERVKGPDGEESAGLGRIESEGEGGMSPWGGKIAQSCAGRGGESGRSGGGTPQVCV